MSQSGFADTIVAVSQSPASPDATNPDAVGGYPQYLAVSWTSADAYSNVAISFESDNVQGVGGGGPTTHAGTAYLMTQIGPGTTTAQEIASTSFIEPVGAGPLQLFSGLTLNSGTYYLVLAAGQSTALSGTASWTASTVAPVLQTDSGVTLGSDYSTDPPNAFNTLAFAPSVPFFSEPLNLEFAVTGDPIAGAPEPGSWMLLLLAGMLLTGFRLMKRIQTRRN